ncbi:MAG: SDR family NAD(P)-dependent oxidoreductase [Acidobacteriota bacterium]
MATLRDRTLIITGASSGIGASLAHECARRGANLGLLARRTDRLEALAEELAPTGVNVAWASADVTDDDGLSQALDQLEAELGQVDIMVANAGYNRPEGASDFKPGRGLAIYDVNLLGTLRAFDWALPRFLEQGSGQLVGVASVASFFGLPGNAAYCGSKAAMRYHMQSLRLTFKRKRIAVTTICPGFVESELTGKMKGKFPMPFMWPTAKATRKIADAIEQRRAEVVFPWQMRLGVGLITRLPRPVAEKLIGG